MYLREAIIRDVRHFQRSSVVLGTISKGIDDRLDREMIFPFSEFIIDYADQGYVGIIEQDPRGYHMGLKNNQSFYFLVTHVHEKRNSLSKESFTYFRAIPVCKENDMSNLVYYPDTFRQIPLLEGLRYRVRPNRISEKDEFKGCFQFNFPDLPKTDGIILYNPNIDVQLGKSVWVIAKHVEEQGHQDDKTIVTAQPIPLVHEGNTIMALVEETSDGLKAKVPGYDITVRSNQPIRERLYHIKITKDLGKGDSDSRLDLPPYYRLLKVRPIKLEGKIIEPSFDDLKT
jgi:hypothetical protein|tara:strand:+ start:94 stop:951 length:858 start_codon:yes stop_codon:yes gene_type:complete